jgi:hypothetical protein
MPIRLKDSYGKYIYAFTDEILVDCPKCGKQAIVIGRNFKFSGSGTQEVKIVCKSCGHNKYLEKVPNSILFSPGEKNMAGKYILIGAPVDPFFHEPLWLRTSCCNHTLWAYNYRHLAFLQSHVEAELRERHNLPMANSSLGSRLPKWMTSKENRSAVLKCISNLQGKQ